MPYEHPVYTALLARIKPIIDAPPFTPSYRDAYTMEARGGALERALGIPSIYPTFSLGFFTPSTTWHYHQYIPTSGFYIGGTSPPLTARIYSYQWYLSLQFTLRPNAGVEGALKLLDWLNAVFAWMSLPVTIEQLDRTEITIVSPVNSLHHPLRYDGANYYAVLYLGYAGVISPTTSPRAPTV